MTKQKQTREELERRLNSSEFEIKVFTISYIVALVFGIIFFILYENLSQENTMLKESCNLTEEVKEVQEVDYHSSGELFCQHYGAEYHSRDFMEDECVWLKEDVYKSCVIRSDNWKWAFKRNCEVIN